ncbi:MAG: hypothetical protein JST00_26465 [Deltaproteobacteria bacterium]|nr:hypothetical protein [Deltaproteobacteria bacterium]
MRSTAADRALSARGPDLVVVDDVLRTEAARAAADAWLARDPSGVYAARVRAIRSTLGDP